jgi:hypothetical protein
MSGARHLRPAKGVRCCERILVIEMTFHRDTFDRKQARITRLVELDVDMGVASGHAPHAAPKLLVGICAAE